MTQPRTDALLVLAIVTQATPHPTPPAQWTDAVGGG